MELSTGPPVVGQRSSGSAGAAHARRTRPAPRTPTGARASSTTSTARGRRRTASGARSRGRTPRTSSSSPASAASARSGRSIAVHLTGRTPDAVRNRWHRLQRTHSLANTEEGNAALDQLLIVAGVLHRRRPRRARFSQAPGSAAAAAAAAAAGPPPPPPPPAQPQPPPPPPPPPRPPRREGARREVRAWLRPQQPSDVEAGGGRAGRGAPWCAASASSGAKSPPLSPAARILRFATGGSACKSEREERRKNPPPGKPRSRERARHRRPASRCLPAGAPHRRGRSGTGRPSRGCDLRTVLFDGRQRVGRVDEESPPTTDAASPGAAAFEGLSMDESDPNTLMGMTALATVHTEVRPAPPPRPPARPRPPRPLTLPPSALPRSDRRPRLATDPSRSSR